LGESVFADWQKVKLQEMPEEIPAGSMPRYINVVLQR
jgi:DNA replication licensing factor MCM6